MIKVLLPNGEKVSLTSEEAEKVRSLGLKHAPFTGYPLIYENEKQPVDAPDKIDTGKLGDVDQDRFKTAEDDSPAREVPGPRGTRE